MKKRAKTTLIRLAGLALIVAGFGLGFVPFIPGVIFVIIGIYLVSLRSFWLKNHLDAVRNNHPKLDSVIKKFESGIESIALKIKDFFIKK